MTGMEIPYGHLSAMALRGIIEEFVLREGTEYGPREFNLEEKVARVKRQLESGEARIVYDPDEGSCDIHRSPANEAGRQPQVDAVE